MSIDYEAVFVIGYFMGNTRDDEDGDLEERVEEICEKLGCYLQLANDGYDEPFDYYIEPECKERDYETKGNPYTPEEINKAIAAAIKVKEEATAKGITLGDLYIGPRLLVL